VPAPTSKTPAGPPSQACTGEQARPPLARTAGAPTTRPISGLNRPARDTRCLRFARRVAPPGRKTRFRLLARLYRVGSTAHWVPPKGFFDASYIAFLLSQAYPGASALQSETPRSIRPPYSRSPGTPSATNQVFSCPDNLGEMAWFVATPLFSLRENVIAKEPGLSYPERWPRVC
jgi:hypothetical protein